MVNPSTSTATIKKIGKTARGNPLDTLPTSALSTLAVLTVLILLEPAEGAWLGDDLRRLVASDQDHCEIVGKGGLTGPIAQVFDQR